MRELNLRKLHRYLGAAIAPLVLMQAASGLILSLDVLGHWQDRVRIFLEGVDLPALALFWNAVLYNVHFGTGTVGLWHNIAVGLGLLALVLTGVLVFVKIMARTPIRFLGRVGAAPAELPRTEPLHEGGGAFSRGRVAVALGLAALGLMALDVYIFAASFRLIGLHVPHFYAASEVEIQTARSRAEFERVLAGDPEASVDRVRYGLERARRAVAAMLEPQKEGQATRSRDREILPIENVSLRRRVQGMALGLQQLQEHAADRQSDTPAGPGALPEKTYRRALEGLEASAHGLAEAVMDVVEQDKERFFTIHLVLFSAAFLFLMAVGTVFYAYEVGRARNFRAIHTARDVAHAYERRFREVVRQAADPLLVFDHRGRIVEASLTASYLLGFPEEELLTLNIADIDRCTTEADREALWSEITPGAPVAAKSCWRHRNGDDIPVVLSLTVVVADDGGEEEGKPLMMAHARNEDDSVRF